MSQSNSHDELHFNDYFRILRNRAGIILILFLLTFFTAYVTTFYFVTHIYEGRAEITIQKRDRDIDIFDRTDTFFDPVFFQTQKEILQSKKILEPVIEKLNLQEVYAKRVFHSDQKLRMDQAYDYLKWKRSDIEDKRGSNVIQIIGLSEDPAEAAKIANSIAEKYILSRRQDLEEKYNRGLETLKKEIERQRAEVKKAKDHVEELRKSLGIDLLGGPSNDQQLGDAELQRKSTLFDDARGDMIARKVRYEELQKLPFDKLIDALPALGLEDANLSAMRQQQLQSEAEVAKLEKSGFGADHPRVQSLKATASKLKEHVSALVEGKRQALAIDLEVSKARVEQLSKDVKELTERVRGDRTTKIAPFNEAKEEADRQQTILDALIIRDKQQSADLKVQGDPALLISAAEPADFPVRPKIVLNLILGAMIGLGLGVLTAFFIEYLDTSVKTLHDVERYLNVPTLAVIPSGIGPLHKASSDTLHSESYRILRAKLNLGEVNSTQNVITMLSGGPGEGKSTTLFNLGFVSAQSGQRVLIIDADLRRPSVHETIGMENAYGMADLIRGENQVEAYVQQTNIPNLFVLTAGNMPDEAMGMFTQTRLREILDQLRPLFDIILVDSPPILGVSDGSTVAQTVDRVVMVIQHRRYPREISLRAKNAIVEVNGNLVGVVLNAVSIQSDETYYYYNSYTTYYSKGKKRGKGAQASTKLVSRRKSEEGGSENY